MDGRGGVFNMISKRFPVLSKEIYRQKTTRAFGSLLDFVINLPVRCPDASRSDWLPLDFVLIQRANYQ